MLRSGLAVRESFRRASFLVLSLVVSRLAAGVEPQYFPESTVKRWQVTGELDPARRLPTASRTVSRAGVYATDLGSSFEHDGRLYFLFGDTVGRPGNPDFLAWTRAVNADALRLDFHLAPDNLFLPITVPGVSLGGFEVPSYGISVNGTMYIVVTTDHSATRVMGRSVLASSSDDGRTFRRLYDLSTTHFINVSMTRAQAERFPGLPYADCVLIFGSGEYRASSPRLACAPAGSLATRSALRYFSSATLAGVPSWSALESASRRLFDHPVVGEFSVAWIEALERWVMLYNSPNPRGIVMRTAPNPWGPWSTPVVIFDPWRDMGYSQFLHVSWNFEKLDTFHDPGREAVWGGEYGPYIIERFTEESAIRTTIYYTMSTWNPYQVVVMSSDIGYPERAPVIGSSVTRTLPGDPGWTSIGAPLRGFVRDGVRHASTFAAGGDGDTGVSHYPLPFDAEEGTLSFTVHGGGAEVVLVAETRPPPASVADVEAFYSQLKSHVYGRVVEAVAGPDSNSSDVAVRWNLRRHSGRALRLYLVDRLTGPWGFVSVSEMTLREFRRDFPVGPFVRGDCNDDGALDISDALCVLNWLFLGGSSPPCVAGSDVNGDGSVDGSDAVSIVGFLFLGGPAPGAPFPGCGTSSSAGDERLGCAQPGSGCN